MGVKVSVNSTNTTRISVNDQRRTIIKTIGLSSLAERGRFANLDDVDATDAENNETVVFNSTTQKYEVKVLPEIDGGTY